MIRALFMLTVLALAFVMALTSVVLFFLAAASAAPTALGLMVGAWLLIWWAKKQEIPTD